MARTNGKKVSYHQRILAQLGDGQWHSLKDIYKVVARFIDAETADVEYRRPRPNWEAVKPAARIAQGKKRLIFLSLNSAIHHRKLVVARGRDWDRQYRLTKKGLRTRCPAPRPAKKTDEAQHGDDGQ